MNDKIILLIEDNADDEALTIRALKKNNIRNEVVVARDGAAALDYLFALNAYKDRDPTALPQLVLLDLKLPKIDGLEVLRRIRADGRTKRLPVVILTSSKEERDLLDGYELGANSYVRKPVDFTEFTEAVRQLGVYWLALNELPPEPRRVPASTGIGARRRLRVLHVEDSEEDSLLIMQELRRAGFDPSYLRVETQSAFKEALRGNEWDVIISDYSLPRYNGMLALADLRQQPGNDTPFILVSGTIGESRAIEALRAGAQDFLLKDKLARLAPAIERELRERDARELHQQRASALRVSEARFSRLAESGIVGIAITDLLGNTVDANDAYLKLLGYTRAELFAGELKWLRMTPPEWTLSDTAAIELLKEHGVVAPWEKEMFRKDGTRVPVLVGVALLDAPQCITFIVDLTARKRAETALKSSEDQLRQAQKMEAVGRLAGGVAHDFNNILSVVLCYASTLVEDLPPDGPLHSAAVEIEKAGYRAAALTRQLLTFSRQEVVEAQVLDLNEVLADMEKMLQRILGEDVDVLSLCAAELGHIRADPSHIGQVILNLVINSRDAMPTGGKLTIETKNVVLDDVYARSHLGISPGPYVMLAVSDTGTGMDQATQRRIFEPFFTTKDATKGTGLGLSTVFGIIQQCKGGIWVYSEPGKGSTFKVYFPRVDAAADTLVPPATPTVVTGTETILLVEDDDQLRRVGSEMLKKLGYRVIEARGADEALNLCDTHGETIDLLLTDVVMPKMSGPELAKRLQLTRPKIKVLCVSGYTDDALVRHGALDAGIAYLQKPLTPSSLSAKVRTVLDSARMP